MSAYSNPSLATSFEDLIPITPSDTVALDVAPAGLRITNQGAGWATVNVRGVSSDSIRVIRVPPASILSEPFRVRMVMFTGTTSGLFIDGYYHS